MCAPPATGARGCDTGVVRPALRVLRAVAALGGAAALVLPVSTPPAAAADQTVQVGSPENRFGPATVRIKPGDTVTWQYAGGTSHTVTATTSNWEKNDPVGPPAVLSLSTSYLFDAPGTYRYVCTTHESVGMRGTVVVEGTRPRPTRSPRPTSSPRPTASRTPSPGATASPSASPSATPSPSAGTATPGVITASPLTPGPTGRPPLPSVAPTPGVSPYLGTGGLTPHPATGRGKGLPVLLALLLIGGVGSAELRALLANAPSE